MKILFITSSRIGDAVLSSGLLNHIEQTYPDAKVTIACGPLAVSLFQGYPLLETIIPLKKEKRNGHWIKLWKQVVGTRWDMVIDLRDSAVSRLILGKKKYIFSRHIDKSQHKAEQNAAVMTLDDVPAPKLWFTKDQLTKSQELLSSGTPILGVGPTANWIGKTWPAERFIEIVQYMLDHHMKDARVAVFGAPGEEEDAQKVLQSIPEDRRIDCIAKGSPGEAAAMIARCDFYIGNDSGLMHCAAAAGVQTLGLFGPSYPHIYAPYGEHTAHVRTPESFDELIDFEGYTPQTCGCLMDSLTVDAVKEALDAFFKKAKAA
jgi:ADP-heptose:LPS heptosyltransferase